MSPDEALPDYYAILQVHPEAEAEIIEVAYRRLMRKYHPDSLAPDQRDDPQVLSRVRAINVAYDILSDPVQRAAYDVARVAEEQKPPAQVVLGVETHVILMRCARNRITYRMLVGRAAGEGVLWRVLGFEPLVTVAEQPSTSRQGVNPLALPILQWRIRPIRWNCIDMVPLRQLCTYFLRRQFSHGVGRAVFALPVVRSTCAPDLDRPPRRCSRFASKGRVRQLPPVVRQGAQARGI